MEIALFIQLLTQKITRGNREYTFELDITAVVVDCQEQDECL